MRLFTSLCFTFIFTVSLYAQDSNFQMDPWSRIRTQDEKAIESLADDYKDYLRHGQFDLLVVEETIRLAEAQGFRDIESVQRLSPGDKVYYNNRGWSIVLAVIGEAPLTEASRISAAHLDVVRIELKGNPLYEREGFAQFQTNYHGGIRNFQWTNIPLALVGRVVKKDGSAIDISFGIEGEPYLVIAGLAPHVDREYRSRTTIDVVKAEELDPIVGSRAGRTGNVEDAVAAILKKDYGIGPEDFTSASLALVPAMPPADVGFDRALIGGYGHDDLLSCYASLRALFDLKRAPPQTAIVYLAGNEETGSNNVMGAKAPVLYDAMLQMLEKTTGSEPSFSAYRQAVRSAFALSADTPTGVNPTYPGVHEKSNAARLGSGIAIKRYGKGNDPVPEVLATLRALLDKHKIPWQVATYKVGVGGGGTLGGFLSDDGIDTIDVGVPILSMHSPWPLCSKADLWWSYRLYSEFYAAKD